MLNPNPVDQYLPMDPETENVIFGEELEVGMEVLVESDLRTDHLDRGGYQTAENAFLRDENNRWCCIERFKRRKVSDNVEGIRWFIGVYADGTKAVRMTLPYIGWVVKKDTIPADKRAESFDPRPDWYQDLYCELTGYMRHNVDGSKVNLLTWNFETQMPLHFREQLGHTTYKVWDIPMNRVTEIEQRMREM